MGIEKEINRVETNNNVRENFLQYRKLKANHEIKKRAIAKMVLNNYRKLKYDFIYRVLLTNDTQPFHRPARYYL